MSKGNEKRVKKTRKACNFAHPCRHRFRLAGRHSHIAGVHALPECMNFDTWYIIICTSTFYLRHVIVRPDHMVWETVSYDDPTVSLVRTDYDRMTTVSEPVSVSDGQYRALKMEFDLPTSSYATMLVREILKTDTSPSYHSSLNKY